MYNQIGKLDQMDPHLIGPQPISFGLQPIFYGPNMDRLVSNFLMGVRHSSYEFEFSMF